MEMLNLPFHTDHIDEVGWNVIFTSSLLKFTQNLKNREIWEASSISIHGNKLSDLQVSYKKKLVIILW